jgi:F-type H+-transporting ATPase subunit epsilon
MNLHLEITTPENTIYNDDVNQITATTVEGEITVLPDHINLLTRLSPGEMIVKKGSLTQSVAITGGFMEVLDNKISILADYAIREQDIQVAKAEEAKRKAEKLLAERATDKDIKIAEAEMIKAILQLKVASKKRKID